MTVQQELLEKLSLASEEHMKFIQGVETLSKETIKLIDKYCKSFMKFITKKHDNYLKNNPNERQRSKSMPVIDRIEMAATDSELSEILERCIAGRRIDR